MKKRIIEEFVKLFNSKPSAVYFAPGRVNLIGEHTDYNGGHVFPCALTIGTYAAVKKREDNKLRFYSINLADKGMIETTLDELHYEKSASWTNYPKAVIWALKEKGYNFSKGFDVVYYGNIPNSSGLSSSASIEILTGYFIKEMYGFDYSMTENALIGQYAENNYVKVNCGIMDQFAIAMGKKDTAIFLDTADLSYKYVPVILKGLKIVIMNTNKKRGLGDSKYNERRKECEKALDIIKEKYDISSLGELDEATFDKAKSLITDNTLIKRARHAVFENLRTIKAVEALENDRLEEFGKLMIESHNSLRDDYEVTGIELDTLVSATLECKGVIGARMTGAGFGGCAVAIVEDDAIDNMLAFVEEKYKKTIGYAPEFYIVDVGNGPSKV